MAKINIKGVIISNDDKWIYDWFDMDSTCPRDVEDQIEKANGEDLEVIINSPGGSVFAGSEIYTALKSYSGNSIGKIVGVAASAASVAAMGVKKLLISPTAEIMIHNVSSGVRGDYRDMEHSAKMLKDYNSTISNAYIIKTGMAKEELLAMMDEETWLTPEQALEHKFVDEIMFMDNNIKLVANLGSSTMLPQEVIDKIRNEFNSSNVNKDDLKSNILKSLNTNQNAPSNKKEENLNMTLEELKNNHPELYNQIKNSAYEEGVTAERERIKNIEDMAPIGFENLVNDAKFSNAISAEQLAVNIVKAQKVAGTEFLNNIEKDAEELEGVEGSGDAKNNKQEKQEQAVNSLTAAFKNKRGDR